MATIMLIDATADTRRLAEMTLQGDGHEVFSFRDARSLLAAADSLPLPQAIVLDLGPADGPLPKLPKASGWKDAPVLVLAEADVAPPAGAADCLAKPYALADLRQRVRQVLAARR
jgi:DNA-binding response OmpR family regulator